ncbi:DUF4252 domain-containing protein [Prolixibacteraceae bacterium Z1-6]|uniref:DUF4252 domain-containing protein n=1 Tax=Draconibacterium aestuarii TaxID=2998507 RepID=A0A9X3F669_9BACT|nr:DUF4252 domain-containing protein [Prolixibacteraceae bacterium Z1-6]
MKKILLMVLVLGISFPVLAQQSGNLFEQLTEKYADKDGFSASRLTKDMFDLYLRKKNVEESSEVAVALKNLDNILVVSESNVQGFPFGTENSFGVGNSEDKMKPEKRSKDDSDLMHQEILNYYKSNNYTLFKTEKRMGEDIKVYLKKNDSGIKALALITKSSMATNLVELQGDIDLTTVASLSKAINLRGLENLYKIDNSGPYFGQFPSSGHFEMTEERIAEMEARAREIAERHVELSEEQRAKIEQQAQFQAQKQMEMAEKYREMAEKYGRQPIFLSTPGDTNTVYYINGKKVKPEDVKKKLQDEEIEQVVKKHDDKEGKTVIKITTK